MAFFFRFSRFTFRPNVLHRGYNMFNSENKVFFLKKISPISSLRKRQIGLATEPEITEKSTLTNGEQSSNILKKILSDFDNGLNRRLHISFSGLDMALESLKSKDELTLYEANLMIKACGSFSFAVKCIERVELAKKAVSIFEGLDMKLGINHYNTLLLVYLENNHSISSAEFLKSLEEKNIEPNQITFQRLLKICCYNGNVSEATDLLEMLKKNNMPINEDIFNSIIFGHGKLQDIESAVDLLNVMEKKGLQPNCETYTSLICGYAAVGNFSAVENTFETCENKGIVLTDSNLLNIIYALALNKHNYYIKQITPKLQKSFRYNWLAQSYIFKLLEKNCESAALELFETIQPIDISKANHGKFLINYYCKNRSASDIIKICKFLNRSDCEYNSFSYAFEFLIRNKNDSLALNFLENMKKRRIAVYSYSFWPILINASKKSNDDFLKVLKRMSNVGITMDYSFASKIVRPNYAFGNDIQSDLETMKNVGVRPDFVARSLVFDSLQKEDFQNVLKITSIAPIIKIKQEFTYNGTLKALAAVDSPDVFAEILHNLLHDFYIKKSSSDSVKLEGDIGLQNLKEPHEETTNSQSAAKEFAGAALQQWILRNEFNESAPVKVLEKMLKLGIAISLESADFIKKNCKNTEIEALLKKLTADDLKMQLNNEMLATKIKYLGPEMSEKSATEFSETINNIKELVERNNTERAMELLNNLEKNSDGTVNESSPSDIKFKQFLSFLSRFDNFSLLQKAYDLGIKMNYIKPSYYFPLVSFYLRRNEIDKAVDLYCKKAEETSSVSVWDIIGRRVVKMENSDLLQKLINIFTKIKDEEYALLNAVQLFAITGKEKEIRKLLGSANVAPNRRFVSFMGSRLAKYGSEEAFHCFLRATSGNFPVDREPIYKRLALLHIENDNLVKVKELMLKMEEENVFPSSHFVEAVTNYYNKKGLSGPFSENVAQAL